MTTKAREYHSRTSYRRDEMSGHSLDWSTMPNTFKSCPAIEQIALEREIDATEETIPDLLARDRAVEANRPVSVDSLSRILLLTHALTAHTKAGDGDFYFRSVASAGALYPFELYALVRGIDGLEDGLYHHAVMDHSLNLIRKGTLPRQVISELLLEDRGIPQVMFFLTSIFFRSAWKYRDRAYRYHLLDTGHLAENLTLALKAERLPFQLYYDFQDYRANNVLGVDPMREVCLAVAAVRGAGAEDDIASKGLGIPEHGLAQSCRVSQGEIDYPAIREMHTACIPVPDSVTEPPDIPASLGLEIQETIAIPARGARLPTATLAEAVLQRRSKRNYATDAIPADAFWEIVAALHAGREADETLTAPGGGTIAVGFIVSAVEGIEPGFYLLDDKKAALGRVLQGSMGDRLAYVCLNQGWLVNTTFQVAMLTNLDVLEDAYGPRGYRYAMLAAGRLGQRLYLTATSLGLGCCGIGAFYDDEAAGLFGLKDGARLLYLLGGGKLRKGGCQSC